MSLDTQISSDLAILFNASELAQVIQYNGNTAIAQVGYLDAYDEQAGSVVEQARLWIRVSDVPSPAYRDVVSIGTAVWRVRRIERGDAYVWTLLLERDERPKI